MRTRIAWFVIGTLLTSLILAATTPARTALEEIVAANVASDLELVRLLRAGKSERELELSLSSIEADLRRQESDLR